LPLALFLFSPVFQLTQLLSDRLAYLRRAWSVLKRRNVVAEDDDLVGAVAFVQAI